MNQEKSSFGVSKWGNYADIYDVLNSLAPYQALIAGVSSRLLTQASRTLDAACGTGNLIAHLAESRRKLAGHYWGIDFSDEMLALARSKADDEVASFSKADLNGSLDFPDGFFDQIASINTLYAVEKPKQTLAEFVRILKPGGQIITVTPRKGFENGLILKEHCGDSGPDEPWLDAHASAEKEAELIRRAFDDQDLREKFIILAEINRRISQNKLFHFFTHDEVSDLFSAQGLSIETIEPAYANQGIMVVASKR
jgi:ubiquinone/menaquinone biosynthesis C-methylase UbiE